MKKRKISKIIMMLYFFSITSYAHSQTTTTADEVLLKNYIKLVEDSIKLTIDQNYLKQKIDSLNNQKEEIEKSIIRVRSEINQKLNEKNVLNISNEELLKTNRKKDLVFTQLNAIKKQYAKKKKDLLSMQKESDLNDKEIRNLKSQIDKVRRVDSLLDGIFSKFKSDTLTYSMKADSAHNERLIGYIYPELSKNFKTLLSDTTMRTDAIEKFIKDHPGEACFFRDSPQKVIYYHAIDFIKLSNEILEKGFVSKDQVKKYESLYYESILGAFLNKNVNEIIEKKWSMLRSLEEK